MITQFLDIWRKKLELEFFGLIKSFFCEKLELNSKVEKFQYVFSFLNNLVKNVSSFYLDSNSVFEDVVFSSNPNIFAEE
jgi:hypothetical protein